jgi:CBS domain containing-hemolysin-like protein
MSKIRFSQPLCIIHIRTAGFASFNTRNSRRREAALMILDTLMLYEVLDQFKAAGVDFALVLNEIDIEMELMLVLCYA